jgi:phospholipase/carboxylesterase
MAGDAELAQRVRPAAGEAEGALVLLHGRGTDEHDLFALLELLDPDRRLLGLTPRGPLSLPPGGAHWYAVRRIGYPDPSTFAPTFERLAAWLDALPVPPERTVIGGFSQGAVMSYALGLAAGRPRPAGVLALSGFMPEVDTLRYDLPGRAGLPVAIGHGTHDPVISVRFGHEARDRLSAAGLEVTWRESPMGHTIDPTFLAELRGWLPV